MDAVISKLGNLDSMDYTSEAVDGALTFRVKFNEYFIPIAGTANVEEEIKKSIEELKYTKEFLNLFKRN